MTNCAWWETKRKLNREGARCRHSEAAVRRWAPGSPTRQKYEQRRVRRELENDLKLLGCVIKSFRCEVQRKEKNRVDALKAYHENADKINEARRVAFKNHQQKADLRHRLPKLFRRVVRRTEAHKRSELERLVVAARAMLKPRRSAVEQQLMRVIRRRFNKAFKLHQTSSYILRACGISLAGLRAHLESLFRPGMTWENHGFDGWHVDHIKPCTSFDLTDLEQQKQCFHYTNLQPLWKKENFEKRDKILT